MLQVTSKDWLINQPILPDTNSQEYEAFWNYQKDLCTEGCTVDGVFIPGKLYWHLNVWNTEVDFLDERGRPQQKYANPLLRDNEWLIFNAVEQAETGEPGKGQKGLAIGGIRRMAKSVFISSYLAHGMTFDAHSQNVLVGLNSGDIKVTGDKISKGLNHIPQAWQWQRIEEQWRNQVTLGIKKKDNTKIPFSTLLIRNLDDGANQEIIAGTKPRKLVIEEGGKGPFLKGLQAAIPGFTTPYGWTCSPIVIFTGGDMTKFKDAKELMFSPDAFNFLSFEDQKTPSRKHGLFLGAKFRMEGKEPSTLGDYLNANKKSDLYNFPMLVSNEEKALEITDQEIEKRRLSGDNEAYLKEKMYYPKTVDDIFVNTVANMFDVEAAKAQQNRIKYQGLKGVAVELYNDGEGIKHKVSSKTFITEWPLKSQNADAPIMIWEFPIPNPPKFLYVFGVDPYRHDQAKFSTSIGAIYIYKRIHSITGDGYQDMPVACYCARPKTKEEWNKNARLLVKYYNAYGLSENDELGFIEYMKSVNEAEAYLAPQPKFQTSLVINSSLKGGGTRSFGVSRSSAKVRNHLHGLLKQYLEEVIDVEKDEEGNIIREITGIARIFDYALLEEIINYYEGANVDRIVAFECALACAAELDPILGTAAQENSQSRYHVMMSKKRGSSKIFKPVGRGFTKRKR